MKLLTVGGATLDIIAEYPSNQKPTLLQEGSKIGVEKLHYAAGGGALNSAVALSRLEHEVTAFFSVANDARAKQIIQLLGKHSINLIPNWYDQAETGLSFVVPTKHYDRIIFAYPGANSFLDKKNISKEHIAAHDGMYITGLHGKSTELLPYLCHAARTSIQHSKYRIAINPSGYHINHAFSSLKASFSETDILISNTQEMRMIMAQLKSHHFNSTGKGLISDGPLLTQSIIAHEKINFTLFEYCQELRTYGIRIIIVTDGSKGAYVITKDTLYFCPSILKPVINTLGAGDAFGSTFYGFLTAGYSISDALRGASFNASSVIQHYGAQAGLLEKKSLEKKLKDNKFSIKNFLFN